MGLDLGRLDEHRERWVPLSGALSGVEVLVRHVGPREQEKFRQKMVREGILKHTEAGHTINSGRADDFFRAYAERYIADWRGDIRLGDTPDPPYNYEQMGRVLGKYAAAFEDVTRAVSEEAVFFSEDGSSSPGK